MINRKRLPSARTNPPRNYLGGQFFDSETDFETDRLQILGLIGSNATKKMSNGKPVFPYELATLNDAKGDLTKRWCVTFYVYHKPKNKLIRKQLWISSKLKTKSARYQEANKLIKEINRLLSEGYHIGEEKPKIKKSGALLTWIEAFDWVYEHRKPNLRLRSVQTLELIRRELKVYLKSLGKENIPLQLVDHELCDDFMQWLLAKRKFGNTSFNNYLNYLKTNFNYLVKNQKLDHSPAKNLQYLRQEEPAKYSFTPEAKIKLLNAYEEDYPALKIFAQYIYYTFIRPAELRRLRVSNVHEKTISIPGHASKNRKAEHVLITPAMERLLKKLKVRDYPPNYYLIGFDGLPSDKQIYVNYFTRHHLPIREKLGLIPEYTLYCWKHTGVVDTYLATLDIEFVSRQCRHSSLDMTKRYLRGLGLMPEYHRQDHLPDLGI
jgi:integrase